LLLFFKKEALASSVFGYLHNSKKGNANAPHHPPRRVIAAIPYLSTCLL